MRKYFLPLVLTFISLLLLNPLSAAEIPHRSVVKAGYFYNGDFMHKAADGTYAGYDVEYYYTLAGYAGWDVQFVAYDSLNDALAALSNGDIDVMSGLSKTGERSTRYLASSMKMCTSHIAVQTRADDDRYAAGENANMENLTCGILRGSNVVTLYTNWCKENGLTPHITEYDTLQERNKALASKQVDAIAAGSTIKGAQKIAEFPSLDLFFMFNRNKPELKLELDRAMRILSLENPSYVTELFERYFPSSRNSSPSFSSVEKKFIAHHPVIKVAVLENDAPFSKTKTDGIPSGILPEYYAHLSEIIGIQFICIPYTSKEAACTALYAGKVDSIGKFGNNIFDANKRSVILSVPYLRMNLVQITRAGNTAVSTVAVPECNAEAVAASLSEINRPLKQKVFMNSEQCFNALKTGTADSVICTQPAATWLLNRNRTSDYVVSAFGEQTWNICSALPYNSNTLRTILNKSIASDGLYISQLITSDTLEDSADFSTIFDKLPLSFLASVAVFLFIMCTVSVIALIIIIRRRKAEQLIAEKQNELAAAVKANQARNDFFGAVSHDMRTPLNAIVGFTDLALKEDTSPKVQEYLSKIQSSGTLLSSLLDDTLTISKARSGKIELHYEPVRIKALIDSITIPVREAAETKQITFSVYIQDDPEETISTDKLCLQKIFLNLLSNAVKYTKQGGHVVFSLTTDEQAAGNRESVFTVKDDGIGISSEFLPHIFEPFAQERRHGYENSGTGLGLAIVQELVSRMGGTIDAQSEPNKGATFTVRLHLQREHQTNGADTAVQNQPVCNLSGKTILVCEDNELNSEIAVELLKSRGITAVCAENGQRGVELFTGSAPGKFAAVLMDIRMPVMDGYEAARRIRASGHPDAQSIPIIAMTADAFEDDIQKSIAAGMNSHVSKPVDSEKLFAVLSRLIPSRS